MGACLIRGEENVPDVNLKDYVICEYLPGREYTVDCFTDKNSELRAILPRTRDRLLAGVTVSSVNLEISDDIRQIAETINSRYEVDMSESNALGGADILDDNKYRYRSYRHNHYAMKSEGGQWKNAFNQLLCQIWIIALIKNCSFLEIRIIAQNMTIRIKCIDLTKGTKFLQIHILIRFQRLSGKNTQALIA